MTFMITVCKLKHLKPFCNTNPTHKTIAAVVHQWRNGRKRTAGRVGNTWLQRWNGKLLKRIPIRKYVNSGVKPWSHYLPRRGDARVTPGSVAPCRTPQRITLIQTLTLLVSSCISWFHYQKVKQQPSKHDPKNLQVHNLDQFGVPNCIHHYVWLRWTRFDIMALAPCEKKIYVSSDGPRTQLLQC